MTEKSPLACTRVDLDPLGCSTPNCGHDHSVLYFHPACHPKAYPETRYDKRTGTIIVSCSKCKRQVVEILVASGTVEVRVAPAP